MEELFQLSFSTFSCRQVTRSVMLMLPQKTLNSWTWMLKSTYNEEYIFFLILKNWLQKLASKMTFYTVRKWRYNTMMFTRQWHLSNQKLGPPSIDNMQYCHLALILKHFFLHICIHILLPSTWLGTADENKPLAKSGTFASLWSLIHVSCSCKYSTYARK